MDNDKGFPLDKHRAIIHPPENNARGWPFPGGQSAKKRKNPSFKGFLKKFSFFICLILQDNPEVIHSFKLFLLLIFF
jgi:hypothetical protein